MRRPTSVEVMLLSAIGLWALNLTVSRYILTHGFQPLAYSTVRYGLASLVFIGIAVVAERSLRIARRDLAVGGRRGGRPLAQPDRVRLRAEDDVGVGDRADPRGDADLRRADRARLRHRACCLGASGSVRRSRSSESGSSRSARAASSAATSVGILLGIMTAATWAVYSILDHPAHAAVLASRISAVVLSLSWVGIALIGLPQTRSQDWQLGWEVWALLLFATLGPLVITNILWFRSLDRIGASRATLATNLQPFVAALFAVVLLGETIDAVQVVGGLLIGAGILAARRRSPVSPGE